MRKGTSLKAKINQVKKKIVQKFDLAPEAAGCMRLIMIDNTDVYLENHKGVVEYTQKRVNINIGGHNLIIKGDGLTLLRFGRDDAAIKGKIDSIKLEKF